MNLVVDWKEGLNHKVINLKEQVRNIRENNEQLQPLSEN